MKFVTSAERIGEKRGIKIGEERGEKRGEERGIKIGETRVLIEAIEDIIDIKFAEKGVFLKNRIKGIQQIEKLRAIKGFIKTSSNIEEITEFLGKLDLTQ